MTDSKKQTSMEKLTANYEQFMKGKGTNSNGKDIFAKAIKKAAKPKQRVSK
jgi:hypothetical protein